jgi:hypothetical protein
MRRLFRYLWNKERQRSTGESSVSSVEVGAIISAIRSSFLTYCGPPKLENLADAIRRVQQDKVSGIYLEAGVALGGSAIVLAKLKPAGVPLRLYDVFAMIPPPNVNDGEDAHRRYEEIRSGASKGLGGEKYYGYMGNLMEIVQENLTRFGVELKSEGVTFVRGPFQDTLHLEVPVAFAHIDCDWYDSVRTCIERVTPVVSPGGIIVFDDYSSYSGCRRAVDEFLASGNGWEVIFHKRSLGVRRRGK